jgi:hypothetical protein
MIRRLVLVPAILIALGCLAAAQDPPQGTPPQPQQPGQPAQPAAPASARVSVDLTSTVDGNPEPANTFQYFVVERLHTIGKMRVDSLRPVGTEALDGWIQRQTARWEQKEPNAAPATMAITGSATCAYNNAQFFGQGQAHNFQGTIDVTVRDAAGVEITRVAFAHSWGRLPARYTRSQTQQEYNQMVFTAVVMQILCHPTVWATIPEAKRADAATWINEQKTRLLEPLQQNMAGCELAKLLNSLAPPQ